MIKRYSRFRRGDVWFLHLPTESGDNRDNSSIQKKSRPYLIVSCEENNLNAPTFNVVPITTRNNDYLPMHVYFRYEDGTENARNQLILCEQVTTVSILDFNNPKSYFMYSFTAELMNMVDDALSRQLGLKPRVADMGVLEDIIQRLAESQKAKIEAEKEKEVTMRVEKLAELLAKKFNLPLDTTHLLNDTEYRDTELQMADRTTVQAMRQTATERRNTPLQRQAESNGQMSVTPSSKPSTRSRGKSWSEKEQRTFVEDYKRLSLEDMMTKYGLRKSSIQSSVCKFRKALGIR